MEDRKIVYPFTILICKLERLPMLENEVSRKWLRRGLPWHKKERCPRATLQIIFTIFRLCRHKIKIF
jgi:hypothetical protein